MPRPKVWGDFTVNDAFEGTDDAGDDLVEFTCPYNCGKSIRMKERNVINNKCTDCRSHLTPRHVAALVSGNRFQRFQQPTIL